ncbi:MAG: M23 family metallopeptidase [Clostridia bacterium]|nr:M23 family metallopeptidase [Clostridia bacterium]
MLLEDLERQPNQKEIIQPPARSKKDSVVRLALGQITICLFVLVATLGLRLAGGSFYETVRNQYLQRFEETTDLSQIMKPQDEPIQTQTDIVVHSSATIQPTPTDLALSGGDSFDDSLALKDDTTMLTNTHYQSELVENAMISPLKGEITSPFGYRIHPVYGTRLFHNGVDIAAAQGTPIQAALSGRVIAAEYNGSYGNYIILDHGNDFCTVYAHCSQLKVLKGDLVSQKDPIATVGSTGVSTGPHLHFEVRRGEERVDPELLVNLG